MNLTTTTQVEPALTVYYDGVLLRAAEKKFIYEEFAQKRPLPQNKGNTVKFRRYAQLSAATTALTNEGVTPPGSQLSKTDLTAQISWYGDFVTITDVVDMTVEDPVLTVGSEKLGYQMRLTRDTLIRNMLAACASSTNASGGTNGLTPTEITRADIDAIVMTLVAADAELMEGPISAGSGQGTSPVPDAYVGFLHSHLLDDIKDVSGFLHKIQYGSGGGMREEYGATGEVRWLKSSNGYTTGSPTQYYLPIIGREAYGITELEGSFQSFIETEGGTADPMHQRKTSSWKGAFAMRILNDTFMHILKVTHST